MGIIRDPNSGAKARCMDCGIYEKIYFLPETLTEDKKPRFLCQKDFRERLTKLLQVYRSEQEAAKKKELELADYLQRLKDELALKEAELTKLHNA